MDILHSRENLGGSARFNRLLSHDACWAGVGRLPSDLLAVCLAIYLLDEPASVSFFTSQPASSPARLA